MKPVDAASAWSSHSLFDPHPGNPRSAAVAEFVDTRRILCHQSSVGEDQWLFYALINDIRRISSFADKVHTHRTIKDVVYNSELIIVT